MAPRRHDGPHEADHQPADEADLNIGQSGQALQNAIAEKTRALLIDAGARAAVAAASQPPVPLWLPGADFLSQRDYEPPFRFDKLWPAGGNVLASGQAKAGKTTLRDNAVRAWCDGTSFLGRYEVTKAVGRLVIIDAEMDRRTARRWLGQQMIVNADGFAYCNIRGGAGAFNILVPAIRSKWARLLRDANASGLLLDCLGPILGALGLDENSGSDVGRFLAAYEMLLSEAGIGESLTLHHMGHLGERSRGASRLRDWPDAEWQLTHQDTARYLSAFGRDVDVPEFRLSFDKKCRWLTAEGGNRTDARQEAASKAIKIFLGDHPESSGRRIEDKLLADGHARTAVRAALTAAVTDKSVLTKPGRRRSNLHWLRP
jgi:hypothetical protein